jgi:iron complex outermembrane receptor protein
MVDGRTETEIRQWVEEPTLHVTWLDGKLRYTGGLWYSHTTQNDGNSYDLAQNFLYGTPVGAFFPGIPALGIPPVPATPSPLAQLANSYYKRDKFSRAVYSQADYDINEQLTVTFGLRYNWDEISFLNSQHGYLAGLGQFAAPDPTGNFYSGFCQAGLLQYYANFNPTTCTGTAKKNFTAPSFNWGIRNKIGDASILYFKIAGGYQAGGVNNQIREQAYQGFLPEKTTEFESGVKSDWTLLGRPIRTNLDGFYGHARDKQEVENGAYADGGQWIAVFNAGALTYYGGDLNVEMVVTDWLTLSGDWTRLWTSYDNFVFPAIGIIPQTTLTGARPAQIPGNTINGTATVYWPMPQSAGKLSTTLTAYHRSAIAFSDVVNLSGSLGKLNPNDALGQAFTTMNFSSSWNNIFGSHLTAGVWVKNLQDKLYRTSVGTQASLGYADVNYGDPRTYGANLRYNFR